MTINEQIKSILTEILKQTILEITFTKVDSSVRVMHCTLQPKYLPETKGTGKKPTDLLVVFDNDKEEWRSMKIDSITNIKNQGEYDITVNINGYTITMNPLSTVAMNDNSVYSSGTDDNIMSSIKEMLTFVNFKFTSDV